MGLAPLPEDEPEALVQIYAALAFRWRGDFAVHTLRVDLYNDSGSNLDRIQTPLDVTEVGSICTLKFKKNYELAADQTYSLVFRLVRSGSTRENGFGDVVKFFRKRDVN
jgi:hypothetical protein